MRELNTVAVIAWGHEGTERIRFVIGSDARWVAGLGEPLVEAIEGANDMAKLFARLLLATDPYGLEPVQVGRAGRTLTFELRSTGEGVQAHVRGPARPAGPPRRSGERWFFGVLCSRCDVFVPVGPDPSNGNPKFAHPSVGVIFAACPACHRRDVYPATLINRRCVAETPARRHA